MGGRRLYLQMQYKQIENVTNKMCVKTAINAHHTLKNNRVIK